VDYEAFVNDVTAQAHFGGAGAAKRAIEAVLHALAQSLPARVAREIAAHLPAEMAASMSNVSGEGASLASDFYARIGERAGLSLSQGLEQAQVVCSVLSRRLEPSLRERFARELPDEIGALFEEPEPLVSPLPTRSRSRSTLPAEGKLGGGHSLSTGRPGSSHPLSEAVPPGAQSHSVAAFDPHEDSKLSSASGLTQEREGETLADGHPKGD